MTVESVQQEGRRITLKLRPGSIIIECPEGACHAHTIRDIWPATISESLPCGTGDSARII